ncbi:MAG: hypothetical protein KDK76_03095 [Chlamydiia bacterium]|nr:hypothetical protein [Chlamydiia bacterium]
MSCKAFSLSAESQVDQHLFPSDHQKVSVITDGILKGQIDSLDHDQREKHQAIYTTQKENLDLSALTPEMGLQWLASLPGKTLTIDSQSFPFPTHLETSKEDLTRYLGEKDQIALQWVSLSDDTFKDLLSLVQEGKILHLKIQGGFAISEKQFESLINTLSKEIPLISLELSNIRLSQDQMITLSRAIKHLKDLKILTLESNGIGAKVVPPFKEMIQNCPWITKMKFTFSLFKSIPKLNELHEAVSQKNQMIDLSRNWDFA